MPDRTYVYRVEIDARSAGAAAAQARTVLQRELSRVSFTPSMGRTGTAGGGGLPSFAPRAGGRELLPGLGALSSIGGYTLGGLAVGALGQQLVRDALELDTLATSYRRTSVAAVQLAGSQEHLNELLRAYDQASGGAVDKATALEQVTKLQAIGFADTAQELERITIAARGASLATGASVEYTLSQMQLAIANKSTMRLDQIGVGVEEFNARLDELQESMTGASEEMVYQETLLSLMEEKYGALARSAEGAASGQELLRKEIADTRLELAQMVSERVNPLLENIAVSTFGSQNAAAQARYLQRLAYNTDLLFGSSDAYKADQTWAFHRTAALLEQVDAAAQQGGAGMDELRGRVQALANEMIAGGKATDEQITLLGDLERVFRLTADGGIVLAAAEAEAGEAASEAAAKLAELAAETRDSAGELGYLVDIAYSAGAGLDDLGDKADDLAGRLGNVRQQFSGLNQLEQTLGRGILSAGQDLSTVVGPTQAEQMIHDALGQLEMARESWRQQGITDPVQIALLETTLTERLITPMTNIVDEHEEAQREADRLQQQAAREAESAFERAAANTERAFRDAAAELENQLRSIPGLFGRSEVTKEQEELAKLGVPQNFADNYLRRLSDEVLNGVDWEGIDIGDAARRAGLDERLDPKAILAQFSRMWADQTLFANPANLDLFDQQAIQAEVNRQKMSQLGQQNILSLFGLSTDSEGAYFTELGSIMAGGMKSGAEEGLAEFGRDAIAGVMMQLKSDAALTEYMAVGETLGGALFEGVISGATGSDLVAAITAEVLRQISDYLPDAP